MDGYTARACLYLAVAGVFVPFWLDNDRAVFQLVCDCCSIIALHWCLWKRTRVQQQFPRNRVNVENLFVLVQVVYRRLKRVVTIFFSYCIDAVMFNIRRWINEWVSRSDTLYLAKFVVVLTGNLKHCFFLPREARTRAYSALLQCECSLPVRPSVCLKRCLSSSR